MSKLAALLSKDHHPGVRKSVKHTAEIIPGQILSGPQFNEAMRVETVRANGSDAWVVGLVGTQSERFRSVTLSVSDLKMLTIYETACSFDGDGKLLRIGLQALTGLSCLTSPLFSLIICGPSGVRKKAALPEGLFPVEIVVLPRAHPAPRFNLIPWT
jgi:hypothetical protein